MCSFKLWHSVVSLVGSKVSEKLSPSSRLISTLKNNNNNNNKKKTYSPKDKNIIFSAVETPNCLVTTVTFSLILFLSRMLLESLTLPTFRYNFHG